VPAKDKWLPILFDAILIVVATGESNRKLSTITSRLQSLKEISTRCVKLKLSQ
jgi:hypothetical protein